MRTKTLRSGPLALVALGLACTLAPASGASQQAEETVMVGGQKLLRLDAPVGRLAIGDGEVADFRVLENRREVLILGRRPGQTSLTIWDQGMSRRMLNLG